ncbi:dihydroorotase [Actinoplanes sp. CA-252034]|uniref:dihydroorotase n=1 Tax=Actinoplanes sp. CA-252034 TaxID=3239906 RepID=UPI003D955B8A
MPNTVPPLFTPEDLEKKVTEVAGTSLVDYGFHAGVDPRRPALVREFAGAGVASVKAFLTGHHTAPHFLRGPDALRDFFAHVEGTGLLALFHAECAEVFALLDGWRGEPDSWRDYERHRPRTAAIVAVSRLIDLCRDTGTPIHVLHVSTREEADLLTAAGAAGLPATFEVTGHHLTFTADDTAALGARIRLSPAIRERADQDRLWDAVRYGHARTVGSDHAPHEHADKLRPPAQAPPGLPGVQELLAALFTGLRLRDPGADPGELLRPVTRLLGAAPAALFGLGHRKGRIEVGLDADLVLFDAEPTWSLAEADIRSKCGWSAYQGRAFVGRVTTTLRRGEVVYQRTPETTVFGTPSGEWIRPRPAPHPTTSM